MPDSHAYALRCDVRIVVHDADTVELRTGVWNSSSVVISDDEHKGKLARIVLALADNPSATWPARNAGATEDEVTSVIETLLAHDVLVPASDAAEWSRAPYAASRTLGMGQGDRKIPERLIVLAQPGHADLFTAMLEPALRDKVSAGADKLVAQLTERDLFLDADGFAQSANGAFDQWRDSAVAVVWPELHPLLLGNLNRLAHLSGFTLIIAVADGAFGIVGPTVVPTITPCYACAEIRVLDAMRDHTLYAGYRKALAEGRVHGGTSPMNPFHAVITSFAAWEAANLLTTGTAFTCGRLLTLYAPTAEILFHELAIVPGCDVCGPSPGLDAPLYADLQGYLTAVLGDKPGARA